jgi:hypothetical protein
MGDEEGGQRGLESVQLCMVHLGSCAGFNDMKASSQPTRAPISICTLLCSMVWCALSQEVNFGAGERRA